MSDFPFAALSGTIKGGDLVRRWKPLQRQGPAGRSNPTEVATAGEPGGKGRPFEWPADSGQHSEMQYAWRIRSRSRFWGRFSSHCSSSGRPASYRSISATGMIRNRGSGVSAWQSSFQSRCLGSDCTVSGRRGRFGSEGLSLPEGDRLRVGFPVPGGRLRSVGNADHALPSSDLLDPQQVPILPGGLRGRLPDRRREAARTPHQPQG